MKVLLTGSAGQVGQAIARARPPEIELTALPRDQLDISDEAQVDARVRALRPDLIINAAAYTAVDRAETDHEHVHRVNAIGPRNLANAAAANDVRLIHLSTDYVFDGESSRAYRPDDSPSPLGVYGQTKLAGELALSSVHPLRSIILRTAWVYGAEGNNFVRTMLRLMRERGSVSVVADQIGTPTAAESIAQALWALASRPALHGVYHWTDAGVASWYDFAVAIAEEGLGTGCLHRVSEVLPIASQDYPTAARRPRFSLLDSTLTVRATGLMQAHWRIWLRRILGEMRHA